MSTDNNEQQTKMRRGPDMRFVIGLAIFIVCCLLLFFSHLNLHSRMGKIENAIVQLNEEVAVAKKLETITNKLDELTNKLDGFTTEVKKSFIDVHQPVKQENEPAAGKPDTAPAPEAAPSTP